MNCRNCATYKAGLCDWYNFGDRRPPKLFSPANKCPAFRRELTSDEVCQRCRFYISVGGYLGQSEGYCVLEGKALAEPKYAAPGFYGYDPRTIKPTIGLNHCDKFKKKQEVKSGIILVPMEKMSVLERLKNKPKARLCNTCGRNIKPKQRQDGHFEFCCPEHGLFLIIEK